MKTAFIAFAMVSAVSSAFATYCEPHRFICTDPWGDELVSEEENAVGIIMPWAGAVALALPAYPPFTGGVADIRGFGGWALV